MGKNITLSIIQTDSNDEEIIVIIIIIVMYA
jgi:hypothetical protein